MRFLRVAPDGTLDLDDLDRLVSDRTRLVAVTGMSNVTGAFVDLAAVRRALRLTRSFRNDRPHALREKALLLAHRGKDRAARRWFDRGFMGV